MQQELLPFRDGQDVPVYARCGVCARELYSRQDVCAYCLRFFP